MMMLKANVVKNCFLLTFYQKYFIIFQTVYLVKAKTFNWREGFAKKTEVSCMSSRSDYDKRR